MHLWHNFCCEDAECNNIILANFAHLTYDYRQGHASWRKVRMLLSFYNVILSQRQAQGSASIESFRLYFQWSSSSDGLDRKCLLMKIDSFSLRFCRFIYWLISELLYAPCLGFIIYEYPLSSTILLDANNLNGVPFLIR